MPVSRMLAAQSVLRRDDLVESWHPAATIGDTARAAGAGAFGFMRAVQPSEGVGSTPRGRGRLAAATVLATGLSLATAAPVDAASAYCSPSGDYCTSARKHAGVRQLTISTFSFRGDVDICVQAPGGEDPVCQTLPLEAGKGKAADLYSASVVWSKHYPRTPKGKRTVVFQSHDTRLGPKLTFTAR